MIAVIQVEQWSACGFWRRMRYRMRRFAAEWEEASCPQGSYWLVRVCDKKIPWDRLQKSAAEQSIRFLLPMGLRPPESFPAFSADADWREPFFYAWAGRLLAQMGVPMEGRQLILADRQGVHLDWIADWRNVSQSFRVVSQEQDRCQQLSQDLLEEYGIVLWYGPSMPEKAGGILLDSEGWLRPWKGFGGVVLTSRREGGKGICLEPSHQEAERWTPPGIEPQLFLAAAVQEGWILPAELGCRGWQNGSCLGEKELLQQMEESCRTG